MQAEITFDSLSLGLKLIFSDLFLELETKSFILVNEQKVFSEEEVQ
jgi:hypothetical protein